MGSCHHRAVLVVIGSCRAGGVSRRFKNSGNRVSGVFSLKPGKRLRQPHIDMKGAIETARATGLRIGHEVGDGEVVEDGDVGSGRRMPQGIEAGYGILPTLVSAHNAEIGFCQPQHLTGIDVRGGFCRRDPAVRPRIPTTWPERASFATIWAA